MTTSAVWYRMHPSVRVMATGLFGYVSASALATLYFPSGAARIATSAVTAFVFLASAVWAERQLHRDFGSAQRFAVYADSLRTGLLPAHIEAEEWRNWLMRSRKANGALPIAAMMLVVFGVGPGLNHPSTTHLVVAALLAVGAIAMVVKWRVESRRISELTAVVDRRV